MNSLDGKICVITAAAQGIGRASALAFAEAGAKVIATDVNVEKLAELDGISGIETRIVNVLDQDAVALAFSDIGQVDILFNCAGVVHSGSILDASDSEIDFALDLNVKAQVRTIRAVLPGMIAAGGGAIINMSSVASSVKGVPNRFAYTMSKAGVVGLTKSVAADFVGKNIRVNAICPGTVDSPSLQQRLKDTGDYEQARKDFVARQPIGRLGTTDEIANLAVYLAGATYTTGQAYNIDGGWTI